MPFFSAPVFWVELMMLSALLAVGLYTSYTDFKVRWVANRYSLALLAVGLAGQLAMVYLEVTVLSRVMAILLTALALAFGLTLFGFWSPGDAKLFWAAAVAMPPTLCPSTDPFSLQAAPGALVVNALLCYLAVLLVVPLWRREKKKEGQQDRPGSKEWFQVAWGLAGLLGWVLGFAVLVLGRPLSYLEALGALLIGYRLLEWGLETRYWPVVLWPGIVGLLYLGQVTGRLPHYLLFWGVAWGVESVYLQVRFWYNRAFVQAFPIRLLRAGAVPRHSLYLRAEEGTSICIEEQEEKGEDEQICEAGKPLSEQQVYRLRDLARTGILPQGEVLELEQSIPFVPFLVSAAILTAFFSGNVVPPLMDLVVWLRG